jgi:two-component system, response regulator
MRRQEFEILLIEDNENDAEMTIRSLKRNNVTNRILHLSDGAIALEYLFGTGEFEDRNLTINPRVILLDLKMPKVDGLEVLKRIKSDERTKTIPVVMLTSSKEDPDIRTCYSLGVNSYIVKPVDFEGFNKVVGELGLYWILVNQPPV